MLRGAYDAAFKAALGLTEKDVVPDVVIRAGIRYLLNQRAKGVRTGSSSWWRSPVCSRPPPPPLPPPPAAASLLRLLRPALSLLLQTSSCSGEEFYRRLQAFRDELASMPVAVQVGWVRAGLCGCCAAAAVQGSTSAHVEPHAFPLCPRHTMQLCCLHD